MSDENDQLISPDKMNGSDCKVNKEQTGSKKRRRPPNRKLCPNNTAAELKEIESCKRPHPNQSLLPPRSPYCLIHEALSHSPWKLLVATILLEDISAGQKVIPVIWKLLNHWPTPELASQADVNKIADCIFPIGQNYKRAEAIINFSKDFLTKKWTYPIELKGIGTHGNDAYRIFCLNEWQQVDPKDKILQKYCSWLRSQSEVLTHNLPSDNQNQL